MCAALHGVGLEIQFGMCMAVPVLVRKARERMSNFGVGEYFCATPLTLSLTLSIYLSERVNDLNDYRKEFPHFAQHFSA